MREAKQLKAQSEQEEKCGAVEQAISTSSEHIIETSSGHSTCMSSSESPEEPDHQPDSIKLLRGCDDDLLIPTSEEINDTFLKGQTLWLTYLKNADLLPFGCVPAVSLDAYNIIQDVPPLPHDLRKKQVLTGRALWYVPSPEFDATHRSAEHNEDETWNPELVHGAEKSFFLSTEQQTRCGISSQPDFCRVAGGEQPSEPGPNGLAILVFMWSNIISTKFLEMQQRKMQYSSTTLSPVLPKDVRPQPGDIVVHTSHASKRLVR